VAKFKEAIVLLTRRGAAAGTSARLNPAASAFFCTDHFSLPVAVAERDLPITPFSMGKTPCERFSAVLPGLSPTCIGTIPNLFPDCTKTAVTG
jgi:hypothetical protein